MPVDHYEDVDDDVRRVVLTTGESVELRCEEAGVAVSDACGQKIGRIDFALSEHPISPYEEITVCRLTHADLEEQGDKYKRHGLGTEAVRFFVHSTGYQLELPENDGLVKSDGSHLVQGEFP